MKPFMSADIGATSRRASARIGLAGLAFSLLPLASLAAEEVPPPADMAPKVGRYTMVPAEGGFVRLDTETGTVSQCRRETAAPDAGWRCAAIPENVLGEPDRVGALAGRVDALTGEVARLRARLDALQPVSASAEDAEARRALDFSSELMSRFFQMMREMKAGETGASPHSGPPVTAP